ncbi:MAG: glycosyltransferase family 4 protein [Candidatus Krumholzibacteria bacterium]|nr:glycosyltransferase family 4 protein [Candidatus Krumholzibacteria bacterium]
MTGCEKSRYRIVYFSDAPWFGGAEKYLLLLATGLNRDEFHPELVMNRNPRLAGFAASMADGGVPVHEVSLNVPHSPAGISFFISVLRRLRPAIFHCNLPGPWSSQYSLVAPLARLAGVRHVVTTEHLPMVPPFAKGRFIRGFGSRWVERVITVSENNVSYLVDYHGVPREKIRVVRIGIPEPARGTSASVREMLGLSREDFICVMIGSLEERKGHARAFDALAALPGDVKMLVVGAGDDESALRAKVDSLGLGRRVYFLGYRADVDAILSECDALVLSSMLEATPYVIIEAMASGLPVVASGVYGIPEIVRDGETGILVDPGAREDFAGAILALARDRDRRSRMGRAARRRYEEMFRVDRCVEETQAVYRDLLRTDSKSLR